MKRLLNAGLVALALLVATTLRSHSPSDDRSAFTTGLASAKKPPAVADVSKLPVEEFEDMSLVFSTPTKH